MSSWIDIEANRKALQSALKDKGLYTGTIDGILGPKSLDGMQAVEQAIFIPKTTYFDPRILPYLHLTPETETPSMNLSLLTLIISHLNLLPFFQQDITTEVKVLNSSDDGAAKLATTIAVLEDIIAQCKAAINNTAIPPTTAKAP